MENRNPYHNYDDMEKIKKSIEDVENKLKSNSFIVPYKQTDKLITFYDYGKRKSDYSFNISLTKDTMKIKGGNLHPPTKDFYGEIKEKIETKDCKYSKKGKLLQRKKGNPTFNSTTNKWEYQNIYPIFNPITDIQSFFEYYKEYRQISCGLGHNERQIIVCDFDEKTDKNGNIIPNPLVPYNENTLPLLEKICKDNNIPHFTYLERHLENNHFQIGWILNEPIHWLSEETIFYLQNKSKKIVENYYKDLYDNIRRLFSVVFHSDSGFSGWRIKNPNCVHFTETQWFNDTINREEFLKSFNDLWNYYEVNVSMEDISSIPICDYEYEDNETFTDEEPKETSNKKSSVEPTNGKISRNVYIRNNLRDWIWKYRKEKKTFPTEVEILKEGERLSKEIGDYTKEGLIPQSELKSTIKSVSSFCKSNYVELHNNKERLLGNLVRSQSRENDLLEVFLLWKEGMKNKDIQKQLKLSKSNLDKKIRFIKDYEFLFYEDKEDNFCLINKSYSLEGYMYWNGKTNNHYIDNCEYTISNYERLFP